jgi:hypothetical protein
VIRDGRRPERGEPMQNEPFQPQNPRRGLAVPGIIITILALIGLVVLLSYIF